MVNNQIRAVKVRVIDESGQQLGIFDLKKALQKAQEKGLDLIQVTDKAQPPVCKIGDYGKFLYQERKKERKRKAKKSGELKNLRLSLKISEHDLNTRIKTAENFLKKGYKVRVEMVLRGREKVLVNFAQEKIVKFLENLQKSIPFKIEREIKKEAGGLRVILVKA